MTETRLRLSIVGVVIVAVFAAMFARLWFLQIAQGSEYVAAAESNSYRIVPDPPLRGRILDAKGRVLADDRIANVVTVDRRITPEQRDLVVGRLAELLAVPAKTIRSRLADQRVSPYQPVPVAVDAPIAAPGLTRIVVGPLHEKRDEHHQRGDLPEAPRDAAARVQVAAARGWSFVYRYGAPAPADWPLALEAAGPDGLWLRLALTEWNGVSDTAEQPTP